MHLPSSQLKSHSRRYPWLSFFDVTLNLVLCSGVLALGCALLSVILASNAPRIVATVSQVVAHILS